MSVRRLFFVILFLVDTTGAAPAALNLTLAPAIQNSARGREIIFSGTLTNTSATDKLFLNDIAPALSEPSASNLALNSNSFFSNVPGILLPNESYSSSEIFRIVLSGSAPASDYNGSISIRGGVDIFATSDLATAPFTILSPALTLVATNSDASEYGPLAGLVTITRSGSSTIDLPVSFSLTGTAVNGVAYNALTSGLTLPAGSNTATLTITPIPNNVAEGDRTVILSLATSGSYNLGAPPSGTVVIHDKPADSWRFQNFGAEANAPAAADNADWDSDGIANLLEFAFALDPKISDRASLPSTRIVSDYLTLSYLPNAAAIDVAYIVEASTDLASWSASNVEAIYVANSNPPSLRTFRYKFPASQSSGAFLRLRVQRTDP